MWALGIAAEEHAVRQDAGGFARALHAADDVQQVGVVALLLRRHAPGEALLAVALAALAQGQASGPGLVGEGRIGDDVVVGAQLLAVEKTRLHQRAFTTGRNVGRREVV
jgi:hypothetical protein